MKITKATENDIHQLCGLLAVLFGQEAEFRPDAEKQAAGLRMIICNSENGFILKAEEDGKICGMVNILYTVSTYLGGRVCMLEDMVVLPEIRGRNIGGLLIEEAEKLAKEAGCMRLTLLTDSDNVSGQRFYTSHGFSHSPMIPMRKLI